RSSVVLSCLLFFFFFQAEDGIRDRNVTGVQTCALPIYLLGYFFQNNTLVPNPKEVPIVKYIFNSYLSGKGMEEIAEELNAANLKTDKKPSGRWHSTMIKYILSNEKYIGDSLVQKKFTPDELPLRQKRN